MSCRTYLIFHKVAPFAITGINSGAQMATRNLARSLVRFGARVVVCAPLTEPEGTHEGVEFWDIGAHSDLTSSIERARDIGPYHLIAAAHAHPILEAQSEPNCISRIFISHDSLPVGVEYEELCKFSIAIVTVSKAHHQFLIEAGSEPEKTRLIYNGVDHEIFYPPDRTAERNANSLVFSGALVPRKGLEVLVTAFEELSRENPKLELDVYGSATLWGEEEYLDTGALANKNPKVRFHGARPQREIAATLRQASLCIVPSVLFEAFALVSIEAQACGCPVITFDVGGIRDTMIPGETGIIVPEIAAPALADAITDILTDTARLTRMSRRGPEFVKDKFDWVKTATEIARLCDEVSTQR